MALTPEDVVNKRFQPTKFREGYDQDEVDDFLDEIVVELRRLNSENEELRKAAAGSSDASRTTAVPSPVAASTKTDEVPAEDNLPEVAADVEEPTPAPAPAASTGTAESAAGVLAMAQRLHDEYVTAGLEQRDKIIAEAQLEANGLVNDAQTKSRTILGELEDQKSVLESTVEQLRGFERDYRARLKAYIEGQLRDLDARGSLATDAAAS
ncbi:DivIVA domain-containing protein [Arthrobacter sedimenti]|uniref:DivIVA domain-containing protein n=1 Tax=Arthrobacter sedimenti TaxID=2694931 RepID=UPI000B359D5E|nr:DivIVA domain-containing protein [Arthrobacter sedimenti]OUM42783.1 cell division protein [Arthrobacter agilis]